MPIVIQGSENNDVIAANEFHPGEGWEIYGNGGNDEITGSSSSDFLSGDAGNDTIRVTDGADIVFLGDGADVLILESPFAPFGNQQLQDFRPFVDRIMIGPDRLDFDNLPPFIQVQEFIEGDMKFTLLNMPGGRLILEGYHLADLRNVDVNQIIRVVVEGTDNDDTIAGTVENEHFNPRSGFDTIVAGAGDDIVEVSQGADTIILGFGRDAINIANENVIFESEFIADFVPGEDRITIGGQALDFNNLPPFVALQEVGIISERGPLSTFVILPGGTIVLDGVTINELRSASEFNPPPAVGLLIEGGLRDDFLRGEAGDDTIIGNNGNDVLLATGGVDQLFGGNGNDVVFAESGSFIANLGAGIDIIDLAGPGYSATITDFNVYEDRIAHNRQLKTLTELVNSPFVEVIETRGGISVRTGGFELTFQGLTPADLIERAPIGAGNDVVLGTSVSESLNGLNGNDTMFGFGGDDSLMGGNGHDSIWGGEGADVLTGNAGDDVFHGEGGSDRIYGDNGNDTILGQGGNDRIIGGMGRDIMHGGIGEDTFVFVTAAEMGNRITRDVIMDFESGLDQLDLSRISTSELDYVGERWFSGAAGEVRFDVKHSQLQIDLDGDRVIDAMVELRGVTSILESDLIL